MSTITNPLLQMGSPNSNGLMNVHVEKLNRSLRWMTGLVVLVAVLVCVAIGMLAFQFFIAQREPSAGKDEDQPPRGLPIINSTNCTIFKTVYGPICEKGRLQHLYEIVQDFEIEWKIDLANSDLPENLSLRAIFFNRKSG